MQYLTQWKKFMHFVLPKTSKILKASILQWTVYAVKLCTLNLRDAHNMCVAGINEIKKLQLTAFDINFLYDYTRKNVCVSSKVSAKVGTSSFMAVHCTPETLRNCWRKQCRCSVWALEVACLEFIICLLMYRYRRTSLDWLGHLTAQADGCARGNAVPACSPPPSHPAEEDFA